MSADPASTGAEAVLGASLTIRILHDRQRVRLIPVGEIDLHSVATFVVAAELALEEKPEHLCVDLTQVIFADSTGVRGIESFLATAATAGVAYTLIGRGAPAAVRDGEGSPMVVWSGSTTRSIPR